MTIVEALQDEDVKLARVVCGGRWLTGEPDGTWTVWEHRPHQKRSRQVVVTHDEHEAVKHLLDG